jgi:hypothetical protein
MVCASIVNGDAIDGQNVKEKGHFLERCGRIWQEVPERVVIVRSHTHGSYRSYTECGFTAVSTPAWKLQDAFSSGHTPECRGPRPRSARIRQHDR